MNNYKNTIPRIYHGPSNICGIGWALAEWQRENKNAKSDFIVFDDKTPHQKSHKNLRFGELNMFQRLIRQLVFFSSSLRDYDIFHFYFGKSLLPFNLDLPILKLAGKGILMTYVGSDVRLEKVERARNPYYHLRKPKNKIPGIFLRLRMIWHGMWCHYCIVAPRLNAYIKNSVSKKKIISNINVVKTIDIPSNPPTFSKKRRPIVIHAPTNPRIKGTQYVKAAADALKMEGLSFEFHIFHKVPHDTFIDFLKNKADIVVDQLLSGGYGTLSMEGMTFGKPVCCYVTEDIWTQIPDLPIVHSTIETLQDNLRDLILHPGKREEIGRAGWIFAREHYDRDIVAEKLWQLYLSLWNQK